MLSPAAIGVASAVASAALALWLLLRLRDSGPQTLTGAVATCALAMALLAAVGPAMHWTVAHAGRPVALLTIADPVFTFAFWSGGALMRAFQNGPGVPTRAYARERRPKKKRRG